MAEVDSSISHSTILIADDNPQILELLEAYLQPLDVTISTATNGQEVLLAVEESLPDLILLDIMMPRMSGFEVCRTLKDDPRYRDIQIIMVTALNETADMERARDCGTDDFLSKPVNKIELLTRVQNLLRFRHLKRSDRDKNRSD